MLNQIFPCISVRHRIPCLWAAATAFRISSRILVLEAVVVLRATCPGLVVLEAPVPGATCLVVLEAAVPGASCLAPLVET